MSEGAGKRATKPLDYKALANGLASPKKQRTDHNPSNKEVAKTPDTAGNIPETMDMFSIGEETQAGSGAGEDNNITGDDNNGTGDNNDGNGDDNNDDKDDDNNDDKDDDNDGTGDNNDDKDDDNDGTGDDNNGTGDNNDCNNDGNGDDNDGETQPSNLAADLQKQLVELREKLAKQEAQYKKALQAKEDEKQQVIDKLTGEHKQQMDDLKKRHTDVVLDLQSKLSKLSNMTDVEEVQVICEPMYTTEEVQKIACNAVRQVNDLDFSPLTEDTLTKNMFKSLEESTKRMTKEDGKINYKVTIEPFTEKEFCIDAQSILEDAQELLKVPTAVCEEVFNGRVRQDEGGSEDKGVDKDGGSEDEGVDKDGGSEDEERNKDSHINGLIQAFCDDDDIWKLNLLA